MNLSPTMTFAKAAPIWLALHRRDISERTASDYESYIRRLNRVFSDKLLSQISINDILDYQQTRKHSVGHESINHEITTLRQVLEAVGLWHPLARHYRPVKPPRWTPPKVMSSEEEARFFEVAASKPEWRVAYLANMLSNHTSAVGSELRFLQLRHLELDREPAVIRINDARVKNEFRARVIPLNPPALAAAHELLERAKSLGASLPDHYLFPYRIRIGEYIVNRPASPWFIRSAFRSMRNATGLEWMQHRNFRNQAITKLFEAGAPDETITSIAGHASIRMSRAYSRVRIEAKAAALNMIAGSVPKKEKAREPKQTPGLSVMKAAAVLVKETGIDAATALQIVRASQAAPAPADQAENSKTVH